MIIDPFIPFWRDEKLSEEEMELVRLCFLAHADSCYRENISSVTIQNAAVGSMDYFSTMAAALSTLGGLHAPIEQTYRVLTHEISAKALLHKGRKVPGWGSSFADNSAWKALEEHLRKCFPDVVRSVDLITGLIHSYGKLIQPNPSAWTAATALALRLPAKLSPFLLVQGRLSAWSELFYATLSKYKE